MWSFLCYLYVRHDDYGPVDSMKVQKQLAAETPISYRLKKKKDNDDSCVWVYSHYRVKCSAKNDLQLNTLWYRRELIMN